MNQTELTENQTTSQVFCENSVRGERGPINMRKEENGQSKHENAIFKPNSTINENQF